MLVALSPSIHRLRMSSLGYHGDTTSSNGENKNTAVVQDQLSLVTIPEAMTVSAAKSRPKLSLQTSSLPSPYAKSSKGGLGSASIIPGTATPTTSNTIANTSQTNPLRPSPATAKSSFSRSSQSRPYTQPIGLRSILKSDPESPKLGIKRSHSLFSADSSSPHTTRRVFFPTVKKVKFEGDEKLAITIPTKESTSSPKSSPAGRQISLPGETTPPSDATKEELEAADPTTVTISPQARAVPRTRNGTPPPVTAPSRKKRKVRKWEWTITSPRLPKASDSSEKQPETF